MLTTVSTTSHLPDDNSTRRTRSIPRSSMFLLLLSILFMFINAMLVSFIIFTGTIKSREEHGQYGQQEVICFCHIHLRFRESFECNPVSHSNLINSCQRKIVEFQHEINTHHTSQWQNPNPISHQVSYGKPSMTSISNGKPIVLACWHFPPYLSKCEMIFPQQLQADKAPAHAATSQNADCCKMKNRSRWQVR